MLVRSLSLGSLANVDSASSEIRNRWLESIQVLGNLRHHVARVRTEEAELLLGGAQDKSSDVERYMKLAEEDIAAYRAIEHDADEMKAFDIFASDWQTHLEQEKTLARLVANEKARRLLPSFMAMLSPHFAKQRTS